MITVPERIAIDLSRQCSKKCNFCYNQSGPVARLSGWDGRCVVDFVQDCAAHGTQAFSFGGGEPLEYPDLFSVLRQTDRMVFRSFTTNGVLLDQAYMWKELLASRPDRVQISLHDPGNRDECQWVAGYVNALARQGIRSGINLLIRASGVVQAQVARTWLWKQGIGNDRIVYVPMKFQDEPLALDIAGIAGGKPFHSASCLTGCRVSSRFCSIDAEARVGRCS